MKKIFFLLILLGIALPVLAADSPVVVLNVKRMIYHNPSCQWAHRCTKNCVKTSLEKALKHGARPCKVCGG